MGAGLAAAVLLLARGMNHLLEKRYALVMHAILGVVIASTLAILPLNDVGSGWNAALYALCFALGCAAAYGLDHLGQNAGEPEGIRKNRLVPFPRGAASSVFRRFTPPP